MISVRQLRRPDSIFWIASQMVVAERSDSELRLRRPNHAITIREVLSHMSGLPFKSAVEHPTLDGLPLAAAVRSYAMTPLETEPGRLTNIQMRESIIAL